MKIYCESCGDEIAAANINLQDRMAKCESCNNIFSISKLLDGMVPPTPSVQNSSYKARSEVPLPKGITVEEDYEGLKIIRKWFTPVTIFLTFFCLFWDGFMVMWFTVTISQGIYLMAAFGLLHAAVGVGLTYWCIAGYINKTTITVSSYLLKVLHAPLPFPGSKEYSIDNLQQVYVKERESQHRRGGYNRQGYNSYYYYDIHIIDGSGRSVKIVSGLNDKEQALYIEQEIEKYLGIEDRHVPGSVSG